MILLYAHQRRRIESDRFREVIYPLQRELGMPSDLLAAVNRLLRKDLLEGRTLTEPEAARCNAACGELARRVIVEFAHLEREELQLSEAAAALVALTSGYARHLASGIHTDPIAAAIEWMFRQRRQVFLAVAYRHQWKLKKRIERLCQRARPGG